MSERPHIVVCEDGDEYTERFTRLLGTRFAFARADSLAQLLAHSGPLDALVFDLDFRRTPAERLVDETGAALANLADVARLAPIQGLLILRALRARGSEVPAILCADLDDPAREAELSAELAPLEIAPSTEGLDALAQRLARIARHGAEVR